MELVVRKNELLRELQLFQGIVERKNTIPILANVLIEAKGDEVRMLATDLEVALRSRCQASVGKSGSLTLPAKKLYEIIKALPETDVRIERGQERRQGGGRSLRLAHADAAARGFSDAARRRRQGARDAAARRAQGDGRQDAVRDHRRGHAVFSERREVRAEARQPDAGGDRRPSPGARRGEAQRRRHRGNRRHPAEEDAARARQAARGRRRRRAVRERREPPVLRRRRPHADLADDRRAVPGLRARHPEGQRQDDRVRSRAADQRGQARRAAVERTLARREVRDRQGQGRGDVEQFRVRRGARGAAGRLQRRRR